MSGTRAARLAKLGMTWQQYLQSRHWAEACERYLRAGLPQSCLACGSKEYTLRHRTYQRLSAETHGDLIPLCDGCHRKALEHSTNPLSPLLHAHASLRKAFGWDKATMLRKFSPYGLIGQNTSRLLDDGDGESR